VAADGTLPAAFLLEALAQAGGALVAAMEGETPRIGYLASVDDFRVHIPVRVGDTLRIEVEMVRHFASATLFRGRAMVGDRVVADGRFTLAQPR
jgi:3-hydroxymyristoyl/3-hydroxydecanoyl-(acyl carrier protein) dehydratase